MGFPGTIGIRLDEPTQVSGPMRIIRNGEIAYDHLAAADDLESCGLGRTGWRGQERQDEHADEYCCQKFLYFPLLPFGRDLLSGDCGMLDPAVKRICLSIFPVPLLLGGNFGGILDKSIFNSGFIICLDV